MKIDWDDERIDRLISMGKAVRADLPARGTAHLDFVAAHVRDTLDDLGITLAAPETIYAGLALSWVLADLQATLAGVIPAEAISALLASVLVDYVPRADMR